MMNSIPRDGYMMPTEAGAEAVHKIVLDAIALKMPYAEFLENMERLGRKYEYMAAFNGTVKQSAWRAIRAA